MCILPLYFVPCFQVLPENYEPLTKHNVGNNYGATETVTSLPVNARFEQNGILPNENIREVDIRPSVQEPHPPGTFRYSKTLNICVSNFRGSVKMTSGVY